VFQKLKKRVLKKPVLAVLDLDKKIRIKINGSDYTIGEILSIKCEDGK